MLAFILFSNIVLVKSDKLDLVYLIIRFDKYDDFCYYPLMSDIRQTEMRRIMKNQTEPMEKYSIRLPLPIWQDIQRQKARLNFKDNSECMRVVLALGLEQLKERRTL